jgi:hypothetical protein
MLLQTAITSIALAAALSVTTAGAFANDDAKFPDMRAQWVRMDSAQFDPSKPGGRGQQAPLTAEYQAKLEDVLAKRAIGSLEGNATVSCLPAGMPRAMIVYETMDIIVVPEITYIRLSLMNELRRIYSDGRQWPENITPTFRGYSIGQWEDTDGDGQYDTLLVETRGFKGPRTFDGTPGIPLHSDNQTIVKERIYLDRSDLAVLHDDITVLDHALTRPWSVARKYKRSAEPYWAEYVCDEGNKHVLIGNENYMISADGHLMPVKKDQPPPDLKYFNQTGK